jgi:hypothetical protein
MRIKTILLIFLLCSGLAADNLEKTQKKEMEAEVKTMTAEAERLERAGLVPIYLPSFTPVEGPQARRFANTYTWLFVRYPGLEDSKLGTEGMTGGEKFVMGYKIATAGADIAMSGFNPIGAIASVQDVVSTTRTIRVAMVSLSVSFATWEKSVEDQQQLLAGKAFKSIPIQPANLAFVQEAK